MSKFQYMIQTYSNHVYSCGTMEGDEFSSEQYDVEYVPSRELERKLIERDKKLVEALKAITAIEDKMFGGDWEEIEEARDIADNALKAIGELD